MSVFSEGQPSLDAKSKALIYLGKSPRSKNELIEYLRGMGFEQAVILKTLTQLERAGLIDDVKTVSTELDNTLLANSLKKKEVINQLRERGFESAAMDKASEKLANRDEKKEALGLAIKYFGRMSGLSEEQLKSRSYAFLKRRRYSEEACVYTIQNIGKELDVNNNRQA